MLMMRESYLHSWFHVFDALVIVASFLIDILTRGVVEEVASLVIILRLWRFVKIVEECKSFIDRCIQKPLCHIQDEIAATCSCYGCQMLRLLSQKCCSERRRQ